MWKRILQAIANWQLRRERKRMGLCPKHGIPMKVHGYFDEEYCEECYAEKHPHYKVEGL